jgi:hypothetical protein
MHDLEMLALIVLAGAAVIWLLERWGRPVTGRSTVALVVVGATTGLLAAFVVLTRSADLIPDQIEAAVSPVFVIVVTVVLVALARRPSPGH